MYISKLPKDTKDIFYCSPLKKIPADNSEPWFSCVPIGWNKLDSGSHHSVKRIVSLKEFAEFCSTEFKHILKHCDTRWLSLRRAINRMIEMWEPLLSYFTSHADVEKQGKVRTIYKIMNLLSVPTSNADCERVFSYVRRIKTEFRSSLCTATISSLIGCHFNKIGKCCEHTSFEESLLTKAKHCTHERNMSYFKK